MELNSRKDKLLVGIGLFFILGTLSLRIFNVEPVVLPVSKANEDNPAAYLKRGNRYLNSNPGYALSFYNTALELDPTHEEAMYQRAIAYGRVGNLEAALADINTLIDTQPDDAIYYFIRANLNKQVGKIDLAIADYSQALALNPDYEVPYFNRANTYLELGCTDKAQADYEAFIELHGRRDNLTLLAERRIAEMDEVTTTTAEQCRA